MNRPEYVEVDHLVYLDELRESGVTNMLGARPYLMVEFAELESDIAGKIVSYWIKTFGKEKR